MNSNNYVQSLENDAFGGQFDFTPSMDTFDCNGDLQDCIDFDSSVFNDEDDLSVTSSLCAASKKISKLSPEDSNKRSQKRSKRGRNPWTPKEDAKLMELMKKYGQSWAMISSHLPGRTGKQVRDRFLNKLRPGVRLGDWSPAEDELLVRLCREVGNRWSLIATHLPGRTEGQVKNRFYSYIKKRLQNSGNLSQTSSNSSSRNISETSSFAASPVEEGTTFDFRQDFDFNLSNPVNFVNNTYTTIPMGSMIAKGPFIQEIYSDQDTTNNSSVASYSPVRMIPNDPTDVISYDAPVSAFCRQFSCYENQKVNNVVIRPAHNLNAVASDVDAFFSQEIKENAAVEAENERFMKLNQRKALLELALAETLNEIKGF